MTITTEEAERLAIILNRLDMDRNAAALRSLAAERDALRQERDGANALVERMHEQDVLAIKAWQAAHPGSELTWPSSARLSGWCMGEVANVTGERDALKARVAELEARLRALLECPVIAVARHHDPDSYCDETVFAETKARATLGETQ